MEQTNNPNGNRTNQLTAIPTVKRERKRLMKRYPGTLSEVSRKLRVRRATVTNVWALRDNSAKVIAALIEAFNNKIQAEQLTEKQSELVGA